MSLFQRYRWFVAAAGITAAFAVVSLTAHKSPALTAFADLFGLALMLSPPASCSPMQSQVQTRSAVSGR